MTVAGGIPPLVLIQGPEALLAERALAQVLADIRLHQPDIEVIRRGVGQLPPGELTAQASPSLFGDAKLLVVEEADEAGEELQAELLTVIATADEDLRLVVVHRGGNRGKRVLDALKAGRARVMEAQAIKSDRDKHDFTTNEFRRAGRTIQPEAVRALVEAVGSDLAELAAACRQLIDDTTGPIEQQAVATYHGGKVEATGFRVADAAIAGDAGEALRLLRHAIGTGLDPVPIVAVLASQLRQLVKVGAAGRGRSADIARELGLAPWQVDRARRALSGWDGAALGRCIQAVAAADFDVKGGGRDPVYAVERAILTIAAARAG
ncbi:MAG: DNA polymerase III subunit delta [Tetrasphaera sp.]|jgi:DNA polymerase-3 subunit delta|nr:DNA polymerase III subunit delta [Tetrasphaera sp.]